MIWVKRSSVIPVCRVSEVFHSTTSAIFLKDRFRVIKARHHTDKRAVTHYLS